YIEAAATLQLGQCQVYPLLHPLQVGIRCQLVGLIAVVLAQTIWRIGNDQIKCSIGDACKPDQRILAVNAITPVVRRLPRTRHYLRRYSAERACACKPSPYASSAATLPSVCAPASLTIRMLERFWKS